MAITLDTLHLVFSAFGLVQKIATFEKGQGFQALVQYSDPHTAEQVHRLVWLCHNVGHQSWAPPLWPDSLWHQCMHEEHPACHHCLAGLRCAMSRSRMDAVQKLGDL